MNATRLLHPDFVRTGVVASSATDLLRSMAEELRERGTVKDSFADALLAREEKFPTGLPTAPIGVAIPHTDVEHVNESFVSVARLGRPVAFHQMGANEQTVEVSLVVMLALADSAAQLPMLQSLIGMFSDAATMNALVEAEGSRELHDVFASTIS
ncbi:PTS sugar transporter subunit IIA [Aeromicrobium sp. YIM 150415]|uniref:PTS sugar transporter subunit IIA n=1 Tax=Aeromicrobium sp. YIM 150415 TaxID=2803912 RepID=UPI001965D45D|nr:PTS sugar transporter subunit IIA [Aeromicrobium sp. YIM 150415]MBM9464668.1 PTS sugar transporter subunit IIA [Aeromicrobium sp. YIM 150415]